jgi:lactobin A/cerein 7B family class IIb bacteriocin
MTNLFPELQLKDLGLTQLDEKETSNVNGGFLPVLLATLSIFGGVALLAYGAGYLYGKLTCDN